MEEALEEFVDVEDVEEIEELEEFGEEEVEETDELLDDVITCPISAARY